MQLSRALACFILAIDTEGKEELLEMKPFARLRVVSNFGDSDRGAGENTHTRARNSRGDATRREREK